MMTDNGPTTPNCSFIYDTAVYYDELDPSKAEIQKLRDKLEHNKWGFSVCDPHRDGQGEQMKRFKQSFQDSRHAIVFLSPAVLERMNTDKEDGVEFKMLTFLAGILGSHDVKLKRRLIPVVFGIGDGNFQKPFLLSDFSILRPEKKGFHRHLYRSLSKLAGPDTVTQRQIRQRVDAMGRNRYTDQDVTEVATRLEIPEEVLEDIKKEYGGHKAMLIETLECWRISHGPEATVAILDGVLERSSTTRSQVADLPPQSMVRTHLTEEPVSRTPIQRQTTTSEVQGRADETDEGLLTYEENLIVNTEEAQLSARLSSEPDAVTSETEAPNTESDVERQTDETGAHGQLPPESEVDSNAAEPPDTGEEKASAGAEASQLVHLEQGMQNVIVNNYTIRNIYITNSDMVQVGDSNAIQVSQTDVGEENLEEEEEDSVDVEEPTQTGRNQVGPAADMSNDQNSSGPADLQQFEQDCAAAPPELATPPDSREVESGTGLEGNTAEKPPVASNTEEEIVSDGLEEHASPGDGAQGLQDDQREQNPVPTDSDVQAATEEVQRLHLDSPPTVEASQDSAKKKNLLSRFTSSFRGIRETASDLKKRLTPQKRSDKRTVQRSTSSPYAGGTNGKSLMMTRSTSFDSGRATTAAASVRTNPAVPAKSTTVKSASEKLQEEERMVRSLPNPPDDKVEGRKNEKTKKKKAEASAPLAAI